MALILLPSLLAREADGRGRFESDAERLGDALRGLPIANLIFDEHGELRPLGNAYVDGVDMRDRGGLDTALNRAETVRVVAAIAGGSTAIADKRPGRVATSP